MTLQDRLLSIAPGAALGLLVAFMTFSDGSVTPSTVARSCVAIAILVGAHILFAREPATTRTRALWGAAAALAVFIAWTYASSSWSGAPLRSSTEASRLLLYLGALVFGGLVLRSDDRQLWAIRSIGLALAIAMGASLLSRVSPEVFALPEVAMRDRLAWPITYWNALGAIAGFAALVGLWLGMAGRTILDRALGAAIVPLCITVLLLTFSRGALVATLVGIVVLVAALGPRRSLSTLLSVIVPAAWCVVQVLGADQLTSEAWPQADTEASALLTTVVVAVVLAAGLRVALQYLDARLDALGPTPRRVVIGGWGAVAVVSVVAAVSFGGGVIDRGVDNFNERRNVEVNQEQRLTSVQNNGRVKMWRAALNMYRAESLHGTGAGTFAVEWNKYRGIAPYRSEAHSLYLETLGELGVIGAAILGAFLISLLVNVALRIPKTTTSALALAGLMLVLVAAALDWTWKLAALSVPVLALCGAVLGTRPESAVDPAVAPPDRADDAQPERVGPHEATRILVFLGIVALTVVPIRVGISEARVLAAREAIIDRADCQRGVQLARSADSIFSRPDSKLIVAFCATPQQFRETVAELEQAQAADPQNWLYAYALGIARGRAGQDAMPDLERAARLDPSGTLAPRAIARLKRTPPEDWPTIFALLKLPLRY